jgi:hypothetical protein
MKDEITASYIGELKIGDFAVRCAVLSNEERVIFQKEFVGMLTGTKKGGLERYLRAKNLGRISLTGSKGKVGTLKY